MANLPDQLLPNRAALHTDADALAAVRDVPTRRSVCLLLDAEDRPVQVLSWANPRAGMKRRLAEPVEGEKTRRVKYGELVRSLLWRRVDSEFESDVVHAAVVRAAFPERAAELLKFPQPWFIHADPSAGFPRWLRVERPSLDGISIGPLPDRNTAGRVIELLEDLFDLCRYYHILLESPRGKACAYKDMGRCPAPCDGSVPMEQYRQRIAESAGALLRPGALIAEIERQMRTAAGQLRFEAARSLKARLEKAHELQQSDLAWAGPAEQLMIVSAQPGADAGELQLFLIHLGGVAEIGRFSHEKLNAAVEAARTFADQPPIAAFDPLTFGPIMRHLYGDAKRRLRFCRIEELSEAWLAGRLRERPPQALE